MDQIRKMKNEGEKCQAIKIDVEVGLRVRPLLNIKRYRPGKHRLEITPIRPICPICPIKKRK